MYTIIGIQKVNFNAPDGNVIKGTRLYVTYQKNNVTGLACEGVFLKESIDTTLLSLGDSVNFNYNRFGKVESVVY